eukprot:TRINITY_DN27840_c0_g1_i1.p1 TRINITY_DN27840_c0_g1~~TRINITY_DN27840_c0_g1_i1.p1  ORF type:complete len:395 (+),score=69.24 TRINITY_DN27840_c0_g1_i1:48-1187(+)
MHLISFLLVLLFLHQSSCYRTTTASMLSKNKDYSFVDYLIEFDKNYDTAEHNRRKHIFDTNKQWILNHNNNPSKTWTAGLNYFSDWTLEEYIKKRASGLDRITWWSTIPKRTEVHSNRRVNEPRTHLPDAVDYRNASPPILTAVKNQLDCGSCWAFGSTEAIESAAAIATGKLLTLSPQQLVSCSPNPNGCGGDGGCTGSTQPLAFNYTIKAGGLTTEEHYPYEAVTGTCDKQKIIPAVGITGQVDLKMNDYEELITAVAETGPVTLTVDAASSGWHHYESGILSEDCGFTVTHIVQVVGYGADSSDTPYWIVRNSFGPDWGESGYLRILRHPNNDAPCGVDTQPRLGFGCKGGPANITVCGVCGLLSGSSYPTGAFLV